MINNKNAKKTINWLKKNQNKKCNIAVTVYELGIYLHYENGFTISAADENCDSYFLRDADNKNSELHLMFGKMFIDEYDNFDYTKDEDKMSLYGDVEFDVNDHFTMAIDLCDTSESV